MPLQRWPREIVTQRNPRTGTGDFRVQWAVEFLLESKMVAEGGISPLL